MGERIWLSSPTMCGREKEFVQDAFETNWIAPLGPHVTGLENDICEYVGADYAVAMTTGTAAIQMALYYSGVKEGDVVFCSTLTFAASANPIKYLGATPVFIDSEPESFNMSPVALEKAFEKYPNAKAVVVVNLYGQSADMDKIIPICRKHNAVIIEDAAESLGATYRGQKTGTFGDFGIFSFNGNKIITTSGGGMLICKKDEEKKTILKWITQSREPARHYEHTDLGFNFRMSNVCAAIGRGQMTAISDFISRKKHIFETYKKAFSDIKEIEMAPICDYCEPNYWLSTITIKSEKVTTTDILIDFEKENIEARPIWKPMHMQPFYSDCDYFAHGEKDVSRDVFERGLCLPSDIKMTENDLTRIINIVRGFFVV